MVMSIDEYNDYLLQLKQPPESKEVTTEKKVVKKDATAKKTLKRKVYKKSR